MAKFTQMAPAQTGTTDRSGSGKRRRRRARRRARLRNRRRSNTLGPRRRSVSDEAAPSGAAFSWPRGPDEIIGRTCDRRVGGGAWSSYCFGFVAS